MKKMIWLNAEQIEVMEQLKQMNQGTSDSQLIRNAMKAYLRMQKVMQKRSA